MVGDYVLSSTKKLAICASPYALKRPPEMAELLPSPYDNSARNRSTNQDARTFVAENQSALLFLRLPPPIIHAPSPDTVSWREEWLRGRDDFWRYFEKKRAGRLGAPVQSKQQYLGFVEDLLRTAAHVPTWAIAHTENGFITTEELVETVGQVRKVDAIYSKDFSDLLGVKASIVTAG